MKGACAAFAWCILFTHDALAQTSLADSLQGEGRSAYELARAQFSKGQYTEALDSLDRAQRASPDPRLFWNMAACEKRLGHQARAVDDVEKYLGAGAELLSDEDKREATRFLTAARAYVARVDVTSNVPGTKVWLNQHVVATTPLSKPLWLDQGDYRVRFERSGYRSVEREEHAAGGSDLHWAIELQIDRAVPDEPRPSATSRLGPLVVLSSGVAAAGTGLALVFVTLHEASDLKSECATRCPPSRWDGARTLQASGDALLVAGAAAVVGAVVWLVATSHLVSRNGRTSTVLQGHF